MASLIVEKKTWSAKRTSLRVDVVALDASQCRCLLMTAN
jgi:hypothetical protein